MLEPLLRTAGAVGLSLDVSSSKALADSLDHAVGDDPYFNKLIRILATRCMSQAVYFCSGDLSPPEFFHYGLAALLYTHFTSSIRRYADVVHRLLAASLGIYKLPNIFQDRPQLTSIADMIIASALYWPTSPANKSMSKLNSRLYGELIMLYFLQVIAVQVIAVLSDNTNHIVHQVISAQQAEDLKLKEKRKREREKNLPRKKRRRLEAARMELEDDNEFESNGKDKKEKGMSLVDVGKIRAKAVKAAMKSADAGKNPRKPSNKSKRPSKLPQ